MSHGAKIRADSEGSMGECVPRLSPLLQGAGIPWLVAPSLHCSSLLLLSLLLRWTLTSCLSLIMGLYWAHVNNTE